MFESWEEKLMCAFETMILFSHAHIFVLQRWEQLTTASSQPSQPLSAAKQGLKWLVSLLRLNSKKAGNQI